jgi:tetrahydromethanopterin S-methyltransferase subunit G
MRVALPQMPPSVQQTLGLEATGDLSQWFEVVLVEYAVRRDEYREVLSRLDILEHDVADVKVSIADLHRTMDERFDRMNSEMNERFDRMNERFDRMNERFDQMYERMTTMIRWTVGTLALLGTIMTILMAIAQFT